MDRDLISGFEHATETGISARPNAAPIQPSTSTGRPAHWNVISMCMPIVGLLPGPLSGLFVFDLLKHGSYHPMEMAWPALLGWLAFCALGVVTAGVAMLRAERLWGITVLGFLLSGLPFAVCAGISINHILWASSFLSFVSDFGPSGYTPFLIADARSGLADDKLTLLVTLVPFIPAGVALIRRVVRGRTTTSKARCRRRIG
jgi:hypothetical protein